MTRVTMLYGSCQVCGVPLLEPPRTCEWCGVRVCRDCLADLATLDLCRECLPAGKRYSVGFDGAGWMVHDETGECIVQQGLGEREARAYADILNGTDQAEPLRRAMAGMKGGAR